jgi:glutamine cyclotransferase
MKGLLRLCFIAMTVAVALFFEVDSYAQAPVIEVKIEQTLPKQENAFTQGLVFYGDDLYESTGIYGQSAIRRFSFAGGDLTTALDSYALPKELFGEGIAEANGLLYALTWKEGMVIVLRLPELAVIETFFAPGESWGLAFDGTALWRSDGSDKLYRHSPTDFKPVAEPVSVHDGALAIGRLNELEWDDGGGHLLANVWHSSMVAAIDPNSGAVKFYLDLSPLAAMENPKGAEAVLNGLAIDDQGRLWATGKLWTRLYRISYQPPDLPS